jgi:hypothetical protein
MTAAINPSYEGIQQEAKGPGVDEWRQADKARSDLADLYRSLAAVIPQRDGTVRRFPASASREAYVNLFDRLGAGE